MVACWPMTTVYRKIMSPHNTFLERQETICTRNFLRRSRQLQTDTPHVGVALNLRRFCRWGNERKRCSTVPIMNALGGLGGVCFWLQTLCLNHWEGWVVFASGCRLCAWILQAREKRMFDTSFSFLFCVFISLRISSSSSSIVTVTINNKIQHPLPLCKPPLFPCKNHPFKVKLLIIFNLCFPFGQRKVSKILWY